MPNKYMGENSMRSLMSSIKGSISTGDGILAKISTSAVPYQYNTNSAEMKTSSIGSIPDGATRMMIFQKHQTYMSPSYWVGYFYGIYDVPTSSKALLIRCEKLGDSDTGLRGFIDKATFPSIADIISFTRDGSILKYSVYLYSSGTHIQHYPVSADSGPGYITTEIYFI